MFVQKKFGWLCVIVELVASENRNKGRHALSSAHDTKYLDEGIGKVSELFKGGNNGGFAKVLRADGVFTKFYIG